MNSHRCHVPGCDRDVAKRLLMCADHWEKVPEAFRVEVLTHYKKGQEKGKIRPSMQYLRAARAAIASVCSTYAPSIPMLDELAEEESKKENLSKFGDLSRFKRKAEPEAQF